VIILISHIHLHEAIFNCQFPTLEQKYRKNFWPE